MDLGLWQWIIGALAALFVGISKTGVPGAGILVVPMLAVIFSGQRAPGIMLPMLIFADCWAVAWYRRHADWSKLLKLFPWVIPGYALGIYLLYVVGLDKSTHKDTLGQIIGIIVLVMLGIYVIQSKLGEHFAPTSKIGICATGSSAGFTTMVSNAAGPIMSIYMTALQMKKKEFVGTNAWFFFIVNLGKVPIFLYLSKIHPSKPMLTLSGLKFDLMVIPAILLGVFIGKWMLPRISQKAFEVVVLVLAGVSSALLAAGVRLDVLFTHLAGH